MIYHCEICDKNITEAEEQEFICDGCGKIVCEDCCSGGFSIYCIDCGDE